MKKLLIIFILFFNTLALASDFTYSSFAEKKGNRVSVKIDLKIKDSLYIYLDNLKIKSLEEKKIKNISPIKSNHTQIIRDPVSFQYRTVVQNLAQISFHFESFNKEDFPKDFLLTYQACTKKICYLPKSVKIDILQKKKSFLKDQFQSHFLLILLFVFFSGLLTSLTPCILPLIPITISFFKPSKESSQKKVILSSLVYVLGLSLSFSILGFISIQSGKILGSFLSLPITSFFLFLIFYLFSLSMFDLYEIKWPSSIDLFFQKKFHMNSGYLSKFAAGSLAGLISSPCLTPMLFTLLTYVSFSESLYKGIFLLFVFSLGFGSVLFLVSLFPRLMNESKKLYFLTPWIKYLLAFSIFAFSLYYGKNLLSDKNFFISSFMISLLTGIFILFRLKHLIKSIPLFFLSVVFLFFFFNQPINKELISWKDFKWELLQKKNKAKIIYFTADWCLSCKSLSKELFQNKKIKAYQDDFVWIKYDATDISEEFLKLKNEFQIYGLPSILLFDSVGQFNLDLSVKGTLSFKDFEKRIQKLKNEEEKRKN